MGALGGYSFSHVRVELGEAVSISLFDDCPLLGELSVVSRTVVLIHAEHLISSEAPLLNREDIEAVRESMFSKCVLPFLEVGSLNWGHSVSLLPLCEVIGVTLREETHHHSLHGEDVAANEGCAHFSLVYIVVCVQ